jgi:hypothetical protein
LGGRLATRAEKYSRNNHVLGECLDIPENIGLETNVLAESWSNAYLGDDRNSSKVV